MRSKIWALSVAAQKVEKDRTVAANTAAATQAVSREEAIGKGIGMALKEWPQSDGWQSHSAVPCQIPDSWLSPSPTASGSRPDAQRGDGQTLDGRDQGGIQGSGQ